MQTVGKYLIYVGLGIILIGAVLWIGSKMGLPFGKFPGDIRIEKQKFGFYAPIATSLIVSLVLTILINLIFWLFRK